MPYRVICVVVHGILYYHKTQGYIYILVDEVIKTISWTRRTNFFLLVKGRKRANKYFILLHFQPNQPSG